jgi:hydrophobic/amphiphilic exporter-1 (mainly G- bacteria), HAE1 family
MVTERTFIHPLPRWAHRRPVTALMCCVCVVVIGVFSLFQLPIEFVPETSNPWMWINVPYVNSTPEEVDRVIAKPLEEQLKLMRSIQRIMITSSTMGCTVNIQFDADVDMDNAYLEARDAIDRVRGDFPEDIGHIRLHRHRSDDIPVLWMGLSMPDRSPEDLYQVLNDRVKPPLERIQGVATVSIHGLSGENLHIDLNLDRIHSHGVNLFDLYGVLALSNENPSVGTLDDGGRRTLVRTLFRLDTADDYQYLPIKDGTLNLGHIALIDQRLPETESIHRINGHSGFTMSVSKESAANAVDIGRNVQKTLDRLAQEPDLEGLTLLPFFDQSEMIVSSLESLLKTGLWGGLFALLVLYVFIRNLTTTIIVLISVPLSVLAAVTGLYFAGFSINLGTMMGLMLAIGMLVDNSVVSTENIFRYRKMTTDRKKAAVLGASQVGTAINASTMTTIIVFAPLIFASGDLGIWMRQIGLPIAFSLTASLFISLSAVPLAITYLIKKPLTHQSKLIPKVTQIYQKILNIILDHKLITSLVILGVFLSTFIAIRGISSNMRGDMAMRQLVIRVTPPINYDLDQRARILTTYETVLLENRDSIDLANMYSTMDLDRGFIRLFLKDSGKNLLRDDEVQERIRDLLPELPGVTWWFGWQGGEATGNAVDITFTGNSPTVLASLAEESRHYLMNAPGIVDVITTQDELTQEIHFKINRALAQQNGVSPAEIAQTVGIALMGRTVSRFQTGPNEIDVRMQLQESDRENLFQLLNLRFYASDGRAIPLKTLIDYTIEPGRGPIRRTDGKVQHTIQIEMTERDMITARNTIQEALSQMQMPPGYDWNLGQVFFDFDIGMKQTGQAFLLASILVLLLLGALFESILHPFTILFSLPFALVGAFWALRITGAELNIVGNIGLIILIGIVVNNAIVLVDHINQLRASGMCRRDALLQAGEDRFRPIVMTAGTTILGLTPMAFASGNFSSQMYSSLAITVMGGLISSTILTLLVLPLGYAIMDNLQQTILRWFYSFTTLNKNNTNDTI